MSPRRALAVARRHLYATVHSPPRWADTFFWPVIDVLLWGLLVVYLERSDVSLPLPVSFLLGGVLLWDLTFRSKNATTVALLHDDESRLLVSVLASPISPGEYLLGVLAFGLTKVAISVTLVALLAWSLFGFGILELGPIVAAYSALLLTFGLALAVFVMGIVLRFGNAAHELAWALGWLVLPFAAAFYPMSSLPGWAQGVAWALPPAHVFESMRATLAGAPAHAAPLVLAAVLDVAYVGASFAFTRRMLRSFRRKGFVSRYV